MIINKETLYQEYIVENKTREEVANKLNTSANSVKYWLKRYRIMKDFDVDIKKINPEEVRTLYVEQNLSIEEVAKKLGTYPFIIHKIKRQYKIQKRKTYDIDRDTLFDLYITQDKTANEIAELYNINQCTTNRRLSKFGIPKKNKSNHKKLKQIGNKKQLTKHVLHDLYITQNRTVKEITDLYGIGNVAVYRKFKKYGIEIKKGIDEERITRFTEARENKISKEDLYREYIIENKNGEEILEKYDISWPTLKQYLKEYGIEKIKIPKITKEFLIEEYITKNKSKKEIANNLEINEGSLLHYLTIYDIRKSSDLWMVNAVQTRKKNGNLQVSKGENELFEILKQIDENTQQQMNYPTHKKWIIDFYMPKYDLYVQFDGDYWHGNLSEEKFKQLEGTRHLDRIKRHMKVDKAQNETIKNLIRVTDTELKENTQIFTLKLIIYLS